MEKCFLCVVLPRRGCARHRMTPVCVGNSSWCCWRKFWFVAVFPLHVPGRRRDSRPCDGSAQCQGFQCTALSPQLLVALKSARRLAISAARCSAERCLSSGVTLMSPLGCHTKGLLSLKGGSVTSLCHPARSCASGAYSVKAVGRLKWARWR